jgi:argininosuccinate lyase
MKGLPTGYNKDLQEDKEPVFDAEDTLAVSLDAAAAVVARLSLGRERARLAASGLLLATDVADYLVRTGVPFRQAHEVVGAMVRRLLDDRRTFESLTLAEWRAFHPAFGPDIQAAVSADASVRARRTPQSTHPDAVGAALTESRAWVTACSL